MNLANYFFESTEILIASNPNKLQKLQALKDPNLPYDWYCLMNYYYFDLLYYNSNNLIFFSASSRTFL